MSSEALIRVESFREFVDHTKAAIVQIVRGLHGARHPAPVLSMVTDGNVNLTGVDAAFFDPAHLERRGELIDRFVVPLIRERESSMVAWSFVAQQDRIEPLPSREVVTVVAIDREVHETWVAPLHELLAGTLAPWEQLPPNQQAGRLIDPVQEALR